jgi:hypothetical protein
VRFESRRGPKRKKRKKCVLEVGKFIYILVIFPTLLPLNFKDDF